MFRDENHKVRVWNDGEMIYPVTYSFVKKSGNLLKLRYVTNRTPIETTKFMLSVLYDGVLMFEQDIVMAKVYDTKAPIAGILKFDSELCCYTVYSVGKSCPLMNLFEISIEGNTFENPDLLNKLCGELLKDKSKKQTPPPVKTTEKTVEPEELLDWESEGFDKNNVIIYTDGSCLTNPGPGGAAFIVRSNTFCLKDAYSFPGETTNNICEITAAIRALKSLPAGCKVTLHSDSQYVINAFNKGWLVNWKKNNWIKSDGKEVKNIPLWKELMDASRNHEVEWVWVKGHAGDPDNELCDQMAVEASMKASKQAS